MPVLPERASAKAIGEFPYQDTASHANACGLLLTPIIRQSISGHVPLALLDATRPGTGKSPLAETVAMIAQQCLLSLAPDLHAIREFWPRSTYKVRLPAGTYKNPGFAACCTLTDAQGSILSTNGPAAAPVLLAYQTPVELLQEANGKQNQGGFGARDRREIG